MNNKLNINDLLKQNKDDKDQLAVITSKSNRIIVEAPAGYGKTHTMISMIKYWMLSGQIKNYKHILCMSFSTSAANKMKEDIEKNINFSNSSYNSIQTVISTNFHGFCRKILKKYGYLVGLEGFDSLISVDAKQKKSLIPDETDQRTVKDLENKISKAELDKSSLIEKIERYNKIILDYFVPNNFISYTSIITLTISLFKNYPEVRKFYVNYFYAVCVDEFQDTSILGLSLIQMIIGNKTRFVAFGDSMQQIYGFLGAIPDLIKKEAKENKTEYICLEKNYRFADSENMLILDQSFRAYCKNPKQNPNKNKAILRYIKGKDKGDEGNKIIKLIDEIKKSDPCATFAVLVSQNQKNTQGLLEAISKKKKIFNALFSNDDVNFIAFQDKAAELFEQEFKSRPITKYDIHNFVAKVTKKANPNVYEESFVSLLTAFLKKSISLLKSSLRNDFITETLLSHSLKQSIKDLKEPIFISTIHGSKGLEWDYVIIANFEQNEFPNYYDIQNIGIDKNEDGIKELINKFYVAFTRAKKETFVSYSNYHWERYNYTKSKVSCLSTLPFIQLKPYTLSD